MENRSGEMMAVAIDRTKVVLKARKKIGSFSTVTQ